MIAKQQHGTQHRPKAVRGRSFLQLQQTVLLCNRGEQDKVSDKNQSRVLLLCQLVQRHLQIAHSPDSPSARTSVAYTAIKDKNTGIHLTVFHRVIA